MIKFQIAPTLALTGLLFITAGCQESVEYETQKPVVEESTVDQIGEELNDAGEAISEATSDAVDAVTPDEQIVDIESPLGDVEVSEDPATGDVNTDVDAGTEQ